MCRLFAPSRVGAIVTIALCTTISAGTSSGAGAFTHLRVDSVRLRDALGFAMDRSQTFRRLVATIETSDAVVQVSERQCGSATHRSCLHVTSPSSGGRVEIFLEPGLPLAEAAGRLAHAMQHALEIVAAADIVDEMSILRLYERSGVRVCGRTDAECWDTKAATAAEAKVSQEISTLAPVPAPRIAASYFGAWTLNAETSWFENEPEWSTGTRVNKELDYGLVAMSIHTKTPSGRFTETRFVFRADGLEYVTACSDTPCPSIALLALDPYTADFTIRRSGRVVATGHQTLSRDGTMLVVAIRHLDENSRHTQSIVVWDKQKRRENSSVDLGFAERAASRKIGRQ